MVQNDGPEADSEQEVSATDQQTQAHRTNWMVERRAGAKKKKSEIVQKAKYVLFYSTCLVFCLHVCLCNMCILDAHKGQKKAPVALEPELHMVVSHHVDGEN